MFSWQKQYLTCAALTREILLLPLEHKIHLFFSQASERAGILNPQI